MPRPLQPGWRLRILPPTSRGVRAMIPVRGYEGRKVAVLGYGWGSIQRGVGGRFAAPHNKARPHPAMSRRSAALRDAVPQRAFP